MESRSELWLSLTESEFRLQDDKLHTKVPIKASAREVRHKARRREAVLGEKECIFEIEWDEHEEVITVNADMLLLSVLMVEWLVKN